MLAAFLRLIDQWADSQCATRIGFLADVIGLISSVFTIIFTVIVLNLRKILMNEHDKQQADYIENRKSIIQNVQTIRQRLCEDQLQHNSKKSKRQVISDALTPLYTYQRNYNRLLSKEDCQLLKDTISILKQLQKLDFNADEAEEDSLLNDLNDKLSNIESMFQDLHRDSKKGAGNS